MLKKYDDVKIVNIDKLTYAGNLENLKEVENHPHYVFRGTGSESLPTDSSAAETNAQSSQYFVEARLNRERTRGSFAQLLKSRLKSPFFLTIGRFTPMSNYAIVKKSVIIRFQTILSSCIFFFSLFTISVHTILYNNLVGRNVSSRTRCL